MSLFTIQTGLNTLTCYKCGILFAMPEYYQKKRREDQGTFYCPSGHPQGYYGKTEAEKLREQLDREKERARNIEGQRDRALADKRKAKRQLSAQKGVTTKLKKRVAHGVCPCCNRTFKQLQRHLENKHPEYLVENS